MDIKEYINQYRLIGLLPFPVCRPVGNTCFQHKDCKSPGKVPLLSHWTNLKRNDRCDNGLDELFESVNYNCNIGLLTGVEGGLVVLDVDGEDGWESLINCGIVDEEANQAECYSGATVTTGRIGGIHYWFSPGGEIIPKKIGFLPKLDFIAEGGFVLAPPSVHRSGNIYAFKGDSFHYSLSTGDLPVIPDWIVDLTTVRHMGNVIDLPLRDESKVGLGQRCLTFLSSGAVNAQREEMINAVVNMVGRGFDSEEITRRVSHALIDLSPCTDSSWPWTVDDVVKVVDEFTNNGVHAPKAIDNNQSINLGKRMVTGKSQRLTDLLRKYQDEEERDWLIEGIIHEGEFLWFFAPPNAGKTFVAMDWAMHVASGRQYNGYLNVKKGKVLIIEQDRTLDPIRYLEAHLDGGNWDISNIEENLFLAVDSDFQLRDEAGLSELLGYIDSELPSLVIMDACYKFCANGVTDSDYVFIHRFKEAMVIRNIAVVMLDHSIATPEFDEKSHLDKLYGGQAKRKILDTGLYMKGYLRDGIVDLCWAKVQGAQPDDMRLRFTPREGFNLRVMFNPDRHSWTKKEQEIVGLITRNGARSIVEISKALECPERSVRRVLGPMVIRKQLARNGNGIYSLGIALRQPEIEFVEELDEATG